MRPMRRSLCVLFFLLLLISAASVAQVGNTPRPAPTTRIIGILSAMTLEIETLGQELTDKTEMTVQGIRFTTGSIERQKGCAYPLGDGESECSYGGYPTRRAVPAEPHPLHRDRWSLNPDLRPGDVVIGAKTAYHDYGEWTPEGFRVGRTVDPFTGKPNPLFFPADAGLLAAPSGSFDGAVYGWSVSLESAATIITAIALQRTGRTDYVMPAVAFIVGAHFFRLARAMIGGGGQLFVWVGALIWDKARISKPFSLRE